MQLDVFRQKLEELFLDVLGGDVSPEEINNQIKEVVQENYYYHKHLCSRSYELLSLISGGYVPQEQEYYDGWDSDSSLEDLDVIGSYVSPFNWEEHYYPEEYTKDPMFSISTSMADDTISNNKWTLPVGVDGLTGDCIVNLPDDLLEKVGWKESDQLEWIDRGDGSFELRKV